MPNNETSSPGLGSFISHRLIPSSVSTHQHRYPPHPTLVRPPNPGAPDHREHTSREQDLPVSVDEAAVLLHPGEQREPRKAGAEHHERAPHERGSLWPFNSNGH